MPARSFAGPLLGLTLSGCIAPHGVHPAPKAAILAASAPAPVTRWLGGACADAPRAPLDWSKARIDGRTERTPQGERFAWSGTAFSFRFRGTGFQVELEDSGRNLFGITLDGVAVAGKLTALVGPQCYALAEHLAPGEHRITLTRLTEAMLGESELRYAGSGPSGELLPPDAAQARSVEVIGDSITAAYGVEGKNQYCHFSPDTENYSLSYAALIGRAMQARVTAVAWSGKGVYSNAGSETDLIPMPVLWQRTLPERADSQWDFARSQPDAVVIDLGTNDFAAKDLDAAAFQAAYVAFLARVRAAYPSAAIFCALPPSLTDYWPPGKKARTTGAEWIHAVVVLRNDPRTFYFEHAAVTDAEGHGCDWHPSPNTHARMAEELRAELAKRLGW